MSYLALYTILLAIDLGVLAVVFLEVGFSSPGNFCKYLILGIFVVALFSPGMLIPIVLLGLLATSFVFDFIISLVGFGNPEPHPLGILFSTLVLFVGITLSLLIGSIIRTLPQNRKRALRWS